MNKNKKHSIVLGGLISSAGIFLSKVLGLVYVIPFNAIAGSENMTYYGYAYNIYSYILNIFTAGIPFAIATLVARYYGKEDYKTMLLIKKISLSLMMILGFLGMCFLIITSGPVSTMILADGSGVETLEITKNVLIIISFALFFVPILAGYRGFYQGLKQMEIYAYSQVIEQFVRVFFLLGTGAIAVYIFKQEQIWAIYFAVFSATVAAICALIHIHRFDRKEMKKIKKLAKDQPMTFNKNKTNLLKEILIISIPYLLSSIIAYSSDIVDLIFYSKALESTGIPADLCNYLYGTIIAVHTKKVIAIPQILAIGFGASMIPYITSAIEKQNYEEVCKHIKDTLESVLYIALPLCLCLFFFSKEVMFLLYGNEEIVKVAGAGNSILTFNYLDYANYMMKFRSLDALFGTIAPLFTSLLIASRLRKKSLVALLVASILKFIMVVPCTNFFGISGATISNLFYYAMIICLDLYFLNKIFEINWTNTLKKIIIMLTGLLISTFVYFVLFMIFKDVTQLGRIGMLPIVILEGTLVLFTYLMITGILGLPQKLFKH